MRGAITGYLAAALLVGVAGVSNAQAQMQAPAPTQPGNSAEITFWNSIKDSKNPDEFRAYLQAFPDGVFVPLARVRIQQLEAAAAPPPPPPTQAAPPQQPPPTQQARPRQMPPTPPRDTAPPAGDPNEGPSARADDPPQDNEPPAANPPAGRPATAPPRGRATNPPAPPPSGDAPRSNVTVDMNDPDFVKLVQLKLYNLNYRISRTDGVFDNETRDAIRRWQEKVELPVTGELDDEQWRRLESAQVSTTWGAIAYVANGAHGYVWGRPTRKDAEDAAIADCRRRAGRTAKCQVMSAGGSACLALATYRARDSGQTHFGAHVALEPNLAQSISNALNNCSNDPKAGGTCQNRTSFCADGSHQN